jgi:hypothetical protein
VAHLGRDRNAATWRSRARRPSATSTSAARWARRPSSGHGSAYLARVATLAGDFAAADAHFATALERHAHIGDRWGLTLDLEWLSELAARRGEHADAARSWARPTRCASASG